MILKIGKPIRTEFLARLQNYIGTSIKFIESDKCSFSIDSHHYFLNEVILECEQDNGLTHQLKLKPYYMYNDLLGDEESRLIISCFGKVTSANSDDFSPIKIFSPKAFQIATIKIFGQNRIRKWNKDQVESYFKDQSIDFEVSDRLITHEFIVFEDFNKNQFVFSIEKERIGFFKTKDLENRFLNDFYYMEELGLEDESNLGSISKEKRIKLLHSLTIT